jgi:hypothetical protein
MYPYKAHWSIYRPAQTNQILPGRLNADIENSSLVS